ncbi:hypothetical protein DXB38_13095 [Blautia obeum]|uniref:Uncharacterized protein n=2 Tax=Lachnospiraceae TaxID=186803 RepID=A0A3E4MGC1_9FIRM|nr:hypothetical protein DXD10_07370 [Dorea formicigenerans]RGN85962.1 hypothetical protein DXB38_13095 [Blautia obeum]RHP00330.1 hypothetical protein DWZ97_12610 [Firmicutes bacterium AF36-19BH]
MPEWFIADVHIAFLPFYPYRRGGCPGRNFSLIITSILCNHNLFLYPAADTVWIGFSFLFVPFN